MQDLYKDTFSEDESGHASYAEIVSAIKHLSRDLYKFQNKKNESKGRKKKLKKRIKSLEKNQRQIKEFLQIMLTQHNQIMAQPLNVIPQKSTWLQEATIKTLPKLVDLASSLIHSKTTQPRLQFPSRKGNGVLYLTDRQKGK